MDANIDIELQPGERFIKGDKDYAVIERDNIPGHQIVIDKRQHLEIIQGPDKNTTWHAAKAFADLIQKQSGQDFRLPTIAELQGLYDESKGAEYRNKTEFLPRRSEDDGIEVWSGERCNNKGYTEKNGLFFYSFNFSYGSEYWYCLDNLDESRGFAVRKRT
jgi:hypothetical protein